MKLEVLSPEDYKTTRWDGGDTTELYIWPRGSDYPSRRFDVRFSSATVRQEHSTFTKLPGVFRHLLLLEGKVRLVHQGHREVELKPYQVESFPGDWDTECYGMATDMNLMLQNGYKGWMQAMTLRPGQKAELEAEGFTMVALYAASGCFHLQGRWVSPRCMAVIQPEGAEKVEIHADRYGCQVVAALVKKTPQ